MLVGRFELVLLLLLIRPLRTVLITSGVAYGIGGGDPYVYFGYAWERGDHTCR
jgi:hypothetical protein